jgi:hypothetical protein
MLAAIQTMGHDTQFMGVAIEEVAGAPGHLVAVDGGQVALEL